ncbi:MAG TPA: AP2 domain-containing protein [Rhizomicrobium sp.]
MRRGKYMHKHFADSKYGGTTKALKMAKGWREQMVKSSSGADYVLWRREQRSRPSVSGIVGVGRYAVRYGKTRHLVWEAYWQDADGKRHSRRFFVSVHGERGAKTLACAARRRATLELRRELVRRGATSE